MDLAATFRLQADLQRILKSHPEVMDDPEERIQFIKDMVLAATDELHEALAEVGWKPWATSRHINTDAFKSELVDTFQFFMNLCFAVGMGADELLFLHSEKVKKNIERHVKGYDGVSTKCPNCGRAYDDTFVNCFPTVEEDSDGKGRQGYCAMTQQELE